DDALGFHAFDEARRPVVADLQVALDEARRGLALAADERDGLVVERIALAALAGTPAEEAAPLRLLRDLVEIGGLTMRLEERDNRLDLLVADERRVHAGDAASAGHEEHVAAPQKLLGAAFAENRAAVDLRCHLERDPGREIRLDRAG